MQDHDGPLIKIAITLGLYASNKNNIVVLFARLHARYLFYCTGLCLVSLHNTYNIVIIIGPGNVTRADPQFVKSVATVRVRLLVFVARRDRAGLYALFMYNYRFGSRFSETRPLFLLMTKATRKLYISPTSLGLCRVRALRTMRGKNAF